MAHLATPQFNKSNSAPGAAPKPQGFPQAPGPPSKTLQTRAGAALSQSPPTAVVKSFAAVSHEVSSSSSCTYTYTHVHISGKREQLVTDHSFGDSAATRGFHCLDLEQAVPGQNCLHRLRTGTAFAREQVGCVAPKTPTSAPGPFTAAVCPRIDSISLCLMDMYK